MRRISGSGLLCLFMLLQACSKPAYYPPRDPGGQPPPVVVEERAPAPVEERQPLPPVERPPASRVPVPPQTPVVRQQPAAVVALLDTAEQQANDGNLEAASASLERAIRIDPRNPALWHHLANVRLAQGDAAAAEQLAVKSNSLAAGNRAQQRRNWELIARARRAQDDAAGARQAEQRARALR